MGEAKNYEPDIGGEAQVFTKMVNVCYMAFRQFLQQKFKENKLDLTIEMVQVLRHLWLRDGINQQEIANSIAKDKTSMTYLIDNLSRRNLVERREDPNDRRNKIIWLTKEGAQLKEKMLVLVKEMFEQAGKNIAEEELIAACKTMEKVLANMKGLQE